MLLTPRRVLSFATILALVLFVQACSRNLSDSDVEKIKAMVQKPRIGGSSGDEDAPLTMAGGSLSLTLWGTNDGWILDSENKFYHPDRDTRSAMQVEYWTADNAPYFFKHNAEPWSIIVNYARNAVNRPVNFNTDADGHNLSVSSDTKAKLFTFRRVGNYLLEHPRKGANITFIDFTSGTDRATAAPGCSLIPNPNGGTIMHCPCGGGGDCGIVIHYCRSTASSAACLP